MREKNCWDKSEEVHLSVKSLNMIRKDLETERHPLEEGNRCTIAPGECLRVLDKRMHAHR